MSDIESTLISNIKSILNSYICKKINLKEKLTNEEYLDIKESIEKHFIKEETGDKLFNNLRKLILLSRNEEKYNLYLEYIGRGIADLNEDECFDFISIIVEYLYEFIDNKQLETLIIHFLTFQSSRQNLTDYFKENKFKLPFYDRYAYLINNNYNNTLFTLLVLLEDKKINIESLDFYINKLYSYDCNVNIPTLNLSLVKKVMNALNNENILYTYDSKKYLYLKNKLLEKIYILLTNGQKELLIKEYIKKGRIVINSKFSSRRGNIIFDELPIYEGSYIITIDDALSPDLDGAFSINKIGGIYMLDVYISDTPSFLIKNNEIMNEAYNRGNTIYLTLENKKYYIDMIPPFLSHSYLSLEQSLVGEGHPKNVIKFSFVFGEDGELYSSDVSRVRTIINKNITPKEAQELLESDTYNKDRNTLKLLQELVIKILSISEDNLYKTINTNVALSLAAFPSMLVNYYIGRESEFAIYRENGIYTRNNKGIYTSSVTPLRKFVSDINLMFFLQQKGVVLYPDKKLYWFQDNIDEVINHLNERDMVAKFANKNGEYVLKLIKGR